jgi:hypothetical protein
MPYPVNLRVLCVKRFRRQLLKSLPLERSQLIPKRI